MAKGLKLGKLRNRVKKGRKSSVVRPKRSTGEERVELVKVRSIKALRRKIGVVLADPSTGEERVLLNPHGKYQKYSVELEKGVQLTNTGDVKKDKNGKKVELSGAQRAYRAGYRSAIIDQTKAYKGGRK